MKKQINPAIRTHLHWAVSILILIFLAIQVMPRALGQSRSRGSKQSTVAGTPQVAPSSVRANPGTSAVPTRPVSPA